MAEFSESGMSAVLRAQGSPELSPKLSVLSCRVDDGIKCRMEIIDIYSYYKTSLCTRNGTVVQRSGLPGIPRSLGMKETLAIGFGRNRNAEDVLKMHDFSKVKVIRKLHVLLESQKFSGAYVDVVYDLLKTST